MKQRVILVDCENVHPASLPNSLGKNDNIIFFLGPQQKKLPVSLILDTQKHTGEVEFVKVPTRGKNSLDFHLVYWLGQLTKENPDRKFLIISKDRGFDALQAHLTEQRVSIERISSFNPPPPAQEDVAPKVDRQTEKVLDALSQAALDARPKTRPALVNFIRSLCGKGRCKRHMADKIITNLKNKEFLRINGNKKVVYQRPDLQLVAQAD